MRRVKKDSKGGAKGHIRKENKEMLSDRVEK